MTPTRTTVVPDDGREPTYTGPVEDYLKAIYELERATGTATTTDIANRLAIAPASVTGMVRRLAGQRLLKHEPYRGVRLTPAGQRVALRGMPCTTKPSDSSTRRAMSWWTGWRRHWTSRRLTRMARRSRAATVPSPISTMRPSRISPPDSRHDSYA